MDANFEKLLLDWPLPIIRDVDIAATISGSSSRRYAAVNRALKKGILIRLRRGFYLIGRPYQKLSPSPSQIAHSLYGPSYVSFESSLVYHHWIPEAVYTTTCATVKRSREFHTSLGIFHYLHVPEQFCYLGVQRIESDMHSFFIANPWKALADHYYVYGRNWNRPEDLCADMRIEMEDIMGSDLTILANLSKFYQSVKVRQFLTKILRSLSDGN